jgi:photosystem II stability/assembly factor-like uncharacterized protein
MTVSKQCVRGAALLLLVCISVGCVTALCAAPAARPGWEALGLSGSGGMFTPAISPVNPDLMMLNCDMSAAYISEDGGRHWRMIHQAQLRSDTGCRPAFHPTNPDTVFASSGGQLRVSRDRGQTFSRIGDLRESLQGEIAIDPSRPEVMLAGTRGGSCWISRDGGLSWTVCAGPAGRVIGFHFDRTKGGQVIFAATEKGIWRSDDAGGTWGEKAAGLPWKEVLGFAGGSHPSRPVVALYCTVRSKEQNGAFAGGIYRSRDRGETWESAMGKGLNTETKAADQYSFGPIAQYNYVLTTDAQPETVYALNTSTGFHPPHHDTVFRSDDGGQNWRDVYFMDPRFAKYNVEPDYVTASTGQSFKGGETPFGVAICQNDPERILMVRNEVHITHNGGRTWLAGHTMPALGQKPGPRSSWLCSGLVVTTTWHYYVDPFESNRHYIAYTDIGMARSLDGGKSWIWWDSKSWAPWRNTCYELAFDPEIPGKIWGAFSDVHDIPNDNIISERHGHQRPGGVCVSRDFAASWKVEAKGLPPKAVTSIVLDPKSPQDRRILYAAVFLEGVYKSTDDGLTWTLKKTGLGHPDNMRVSRVFLHADGSLFAIVCARRAGQGKPLLPEGVGLYRSADAGESWTLVNASRALLYPKDFSVDPRDSQRILLGACDAGRGDESGGLYATEDGGRSWKRIGRQGPQTFGGYFHPRHRDWIYMTLTEGAPGAGLWLSRDRGQNWDAFANVPFANIQRVEFDPGNEERIHLATFGGSVFRGPAEP